MVLSTILFTLIWLRVSAAIYSNLVLLSAWLLTHNPLFILCVNLLLVEEGHIVCSLLLLLGAAVGNNNVSELIDSLVLTKDTLVVVDNLSLFLVALEGHQLLAIDIGYCIIGFLVRFIKLAIEM